MLTHGDDAQAWWTRGLASLKLSAFAQAVTDFRQADHLHSAGKTKACLGYAYHRTGGVKEARIYYTAAVNAGFATPEVLNNLGYLHLKLSTPAELAEAAKRLSHALAQRPDLKAALHNRGCVYLKQAGSAALRNGKAQAPNRELLRRALTDLARAVNLVGPATADLYRDAAHACALLARDEPERAAEALDYLARGLEQGLDPRKEPFPSLLAHHPKFASLGAPRPVTVATVTNARILAVIPD